MNMRIRGAVTRLMEGPEPTAEMLNLRSVALYYVRSGGGSGKGGLGVLLHRLISPDAFVF